MALSLSQLGWARSAPLPIGNFSGSYHAEFTLPLDEVNIRDNAPDIFDAIGGAKDDGSDIRFTGDAAGLNERPFDLVYFNKATQEMEIHVNVFSNPASGSTIYIWWGNKKAVAYLPTDTYGQHNAYVPDEIFFMTGFDDSTASIEDRTGNQVSGSKIGTNNPLQVSGSWPRAQQFNGVDSHIVLNSDAELDAITGPMVIEAVINTNTTTGIHWIFSKQGAYAFGISGTELIFRAYGIQDYVSSGAALAPNTWYHVSVKLTSGYDCAFRINSNFIGSTVPGSSPLNTSANSVFIGQSGVFGGSEYWDGELQQIRIFNTNVDNDQIRNDGQWWTNIIYNTIGEPKDAFFPMGWKRATEIQLSNADVDSDRTNIPVVIKLDGTNLSEMFDEASDNHTELTTGRDIRFSADSAGVTPLKFQLRYFDSTANEAYVAVEIPTLLAASLTSLYVWTARNRVEALPVNDQNGQYNTYDDNYKVVYSMRDFTSAIVKDSTRNGLDGAKSSANNPPEAAGLVGKAQDFDGSSDLIRVNGTSPLNGADNITVEAFIKTNASGEQYLICQRDSTGFVGQYVFKIDSSGYLYFDVFNSTWQWGETLVSSVVVNDNAWHHVMGVRDGINGYLYIDGVQRATASGTVQNLSNSLDTYLGGNQRDSNFYYDGLMEEVRISNVARPLDYAKAVWTNFVNQSTFVSVQTPAEKSDNTRDFTRQIESKPDRVAISQVNFACRVDENNVPDPEFWDEVQADGGDIIVEVGGVRVACEVAYIDAVAKKLEIFFIASLLPAAGGLEVSIKAGIDDNVAQPFRDTTYGLENVWSSLNEYVQHMGDSYYEERQIIDSTANALIGQKPEINGPFQAAGLAGWAQDFNKATPDYIQTLGLLNTPAQITLIALVNCDAVDPGGATIISLGEHVAIRLNGFGYAEVFFYDGTVFNIVTYSVDLRGGWHTIIGAVKNGEQRIYVDGIDQGSATVAQDIDYASFGANTQIGRHGSGATDFDFDGLIDEVRALNSFKDANWAETAHYMLTDTTEIWGEVSYDVQFNAGAGGSLVGDTSQNVGSGEDCTPVQAVPDPGYVFVNWTGDLTSTDNPLTITNVMADTTVTANFALAPTLSVDFTAGAGGTLFGDTNQTVNTGEDATPVQAVPDPGYRFVNWTGDLTSTDNPLTITNVTVNTSVTANFELIPVHTVTFLQGGGGSLLGDTVQSIQEGGSTTPVTAVPDQYFTFNEWTGDLGQLTDNPLAVTNVQSDLTIVADFIPVSQYTVRFFAGDNGSIDGTAVQSVYPGEDADPVTAIPDEGFNLLSWTGGVYSVQNPLTVANVQSDLDITAEFTPQNSIFSTIRKLLPRGKAWRV